MSARVEPVLVPGWPAPRGYANGMVGVGRTLCVAGQVGWDAQGVFHSDDLIAQFDQALANVVAVVTAAGGAATDIASMTIYVTDIAGYRARLKELGPVWRARMGKHFPAMALVQVAALLEEGALVEIEATAALP